MSLIQRLRLLPPLAGLLLPTPALAASDCALAPGRAGVVDAYSGACRHGLLQGVADVLLSLPPAADGRERRARDFGWFQRGVQQGVHVLILRDPEGRSPAFASVMHFDAEGRRSWSFDLTAARWPQHGTLLASGPWTDSDGKAQAAGIDYTPVQRADGTSYGGDSAMIADLLNQAAELSLVSGVQSVDPSTLRHFLAAVSITQPLADVSVPAPAQAMLPETDEDEPLAAEPVQAIREAPEIQAPEQATRTEPRESLWSHVLSGATVLAQAAATYAETKGKLEQSGQASSPVGTRPASAARESEICSLMEPAKSQCEARNAAHRATMTSVNPYSGSTGPSPRPGAYAPAAAPRANSAVQCVQVSYDTLNYAKIINVCDFTIEIGYCGIGVDCRHGNWGFTRQWSLRAGSSTPAQYEPGTPIAYAACDQKDVGPREISAGIHTCD